MKLPAVVALACLAVLPALAEDEPEPKMATYEYNGVKFDVHPPEDAHMLVRLSEDIARYVEVDPQQNAFNPGDAATAKEALDIACQDMLDTRDRIRERQILDEKNRPRLEKELQEQYDELAKSD